MMMFGDHPVFPETREFFIGPLILLLLPIGALLVVVQRRWYAAALLALSGLLAGGALIYGLVLLQENSAGRNTSGAVLVLGGITLLLGCAVVVKIRWFRQSSPE